MPQVFNRHHGNVPKDTVYIGRGSLYGNKFEIGKDGTRAEVIEKYQTWLFEQPVLVDLIKKNLKGKNLVCSCKPKACHGDILLELANPNYILDEMVRMNQEAGMYE